jgi:hypothetical protein
VPQKNETANWAKSAKSVQITANFCNWRPFTANRRARLDCERVPSSTVAHGRLPTHLFRPASIQYPAASSRSPYASPKLRIPHSELRIPQSKIQLHPSKIQASPSQSKGVQHAFFTQTLLVLIGSESLLTAMNGYERVRTAPNSDYGRNAREAVLNAQSFQLLVALQLTKQFRNGFGLIRQDQSGRDLGQRLQHKPPLMGARMRQNQ